MIPTRLIIIFSWRVYRDCLSCVAAQTYTVHLMPIDKAQNNDPGAGADSPARMRRRGSAALPAALPEVGRAGSLTVAFGCTAALGYASGK